jgi:hypothetical protein
MLQFLIIAADTSTSGVPSAMISGRQQERGSHCLTVRSRRTICR